MTMPQRPPGFKLSMTCCRKRTCVAPVLYANRVCASLPSLPPKGGFISTTVVERRRCLEEAIVDLLANEGVPVPQIRLIDPVKNQVRERDRVDQVLLFPTEEGPPL